MAAGSASSRRSTSPHAGPAPRALRLLIGREVPGRAAIGRDGAGPEAAVRAAMDGSLSLSLDEAALEVMEALELLQQRREQLEQHLRQGWLSLAQARYSLGCHRVSSLQYGATMVPRVRVCHRQDPEGRPHFEEVPGTGGDPDPQQGGSDGLRQRRGAPEKGGTPSRPPPDPLGWFGVLVPPSLRQAQGSFQKGVTLAVEVAELQATMEAAAARYRQLLQQKRHLDGDNGDSGDSQSCTGTPGDSKDTEGDRVTIVTA
ncbi:LOW QUALITY PROTEIN: coiled-coil domain-containing protein 115 [Melozone crissalis]|uniref:LOW QUALITY PROTEIN: coiled-coil domain-containing protein 115 n=1 Tax=Melozone crissalis TaxID=40204 RepID=UPI0023D9A693|nr:LOW QUALITY PROTEIN: coiled-coil domain-containing protein 115 [Melozone crissalis]